MIHIIGKLKFHILNNESNYRSILLGFISVSFFVFIGKIAGAGKEMAIAWRYGVSESVDAYVFIMNLITFPVSIWLSILTAVLVPLIGRAEKNNDEILLFRKQLFGLAICIGIGLGFIIWMVIPKLLLWDKFGFTEEATAKAVEIVNQIFIIVPLGVIINLFSVYLLAKGMHRNTLYEGVPALVIFIALIIPLEFKSEPLIWGTIAGFFLHLLVLGFSLWQNKELQKPEIKFTSDLWKGFLNSIGIVVIGQIFMSMTTIFDQFYATQLEPGSLSIMSYANRILALILGMGSLAISRSTLPVFSKMSQESYQARKQTAFNVALVVFFIAIVLSIILYKLSPLIVKIIFERGAFKENNTIEVYEIFRYGLIQIPFYMSGIVLVSMLSANRKYRYIAFVSIFIALIKFIVNQILIDEFGVKGLYLSTSIMYAVSATLCMFFIRKIKGDKVGTE